jgi:hypothetical protein
MNDTESVLALTQQLATDNLALWSDDKRKLFAAAR